MSYRRDPLSNFLPLAAAESPARPQRVIGRIVLECTTLQGAIQEIMEAVDSASCRTFAFCNMHTFNLAHRLPAMEQALKRSTVFNDGVGMDIASWILHGVPFPENLNGTDLTPALLGSFRRPVSIYLVGSLPGVAEDAAQALANRFPMVTVVGTSHGFVTESENEILAASIMASGVDIVLAGMGNPRQELWAVEMAPRSGAVILCVGAYIDFVAGRFSRAPGWVRRARCEWIYRLALEPSRLWRRYFGGAPLLLYSVITEKLSAGRRPDK